MKSHRYITIILVILIFFPFIGNSTPTWFVEIISEPGVKVYKKDNCVKGTCFVQVVDLSMGASINLMRGSIADQGENPKINRESLNQTWASFIAKEQRGICVTNGQFFSTNDNPTSLAFPLVIKGEVIKGYGVTEYQDQKLVLQFNSNRASITKFKEDINLETLSDNLIIGLSEHADKNKNSYVGRTFIGVYDANKDGYREQILILNASSARQTDAAKILRDFGVTELMMLDGGASTQLICKDGFSVNSSRTIPQTIGVISGVSSGNSSETESPFRCVIDNYICWSPPTSSCVNSQLLIYDGIKYYNDGTLRMWTACRDAYNEALSEGLSEKYWHDVFLGSNNILSMGMCGQ